MAALGEPVKWDRTIYRGTDHEWVLRRVDGNGDPVIPTSAQAQVRYRPGGEVWADLGVEIDGTEGWVSLTLAHEVTEAQVWDNRKVGAWDLEVVVAGERLRWVMGSVVVSQDITRTEP